VDIAYPGFEEGETLAEQATSTQGRVSARCLAQLEHTDLFIRNARVRKPIRGMRRARSCLAGFHSAKRKHPRRVQVRSASQSAVHVEVRHAAARKSKLLEANRAVIGVSALSPNAFRLE